jgi:hypothetical protein
LWLKLTDHTVSDFRAEIATQHSPKKKKKRERDFERRIVRASRVSEVMNTGANKIWLEILRTPHAKKMKLCGEFQKLTP